MSPNVYLVIGAAVALIAVAVLACSPWFTRDRPENGTDDEHTDQQ